MLSVRNLSVLAVALLLGLSLTASRVTAEEGQKEKGGVSGTVTGTDGKPAAGTQVRLMRPLDKGERKNKGEKPAAAEDVKKPKGDRPAPVSSAVADNDGKFTMTDIPVGKYMVMSRLKGQGQAREAVEVKAGETATVSLKLEAPKQGVK